MTAKSQMSDLSTAAVMTAIVNRKKIRMTFFIWADSGDN